MKKTIMLCALLACTGLYAQDKGLVNTTKSPYARIWNTDVSAVSWTDGFWGERFEVCRDTMVINMWHVMSDPEVSHAFRNLEIAAGEAEGRHSGPPFNDGDFFKWFESAAAVYAVTKDPKLDALMDRIITTIAKAQREDGYMHTQVIIPERKRQKEQASQQSGPVGTAVGTAQGGAFSDRLNFETYNHGHLMTAACVHYRATGKRNMLELAIKAADFLCRFYETATAELARNAICPSHYMGVVEMYRTTGDPKYLELSKNLINIRGMVENGTDDNQDRVPFRQQKLAMGHAVRANYLYAGVADVYAETGEALLLENLESIWSDIVYRKMYITGGCGALYDGTSPDGTNYTPDSIQKVHQAYGRAYQLPNSTAHNETCANIGNMFFNWRMFLLGGDAKYVDVLERTLYNSVLSGISLGGTKYFYTNPLRLSKDFPYVLRWPKERTEYISCFCCPPNTVRTICEAQNYAYSLSKEGVWLNLYGSSNLATKLADGSDIEIVQRSDYPWDGKVELTFAKLPRKADFSLFFRIPGWCDHYELSINGNPVELQVEKGYARVQAKWKKTDNITFNMRIQPRLIESNPLLEETRNQTAVMWGPLVYCLESADLGNYKIDNISIPSDISFQPEMMEIDGSRLMSLKGEAWYVDQQNWDNVLYREVSSAKKKVPVRLIPYYAFGNRGFEEMTVWMPLDR